MITRYRRNSDGEDVVNERRFAAWDGFAAEAERHVTRLGPERRDGGLGQVAKTPDLYRLPLDPH